MFLSFLSRVQSSPCFTDTVQSVFYNMPLHGSIKNKVKMVNSVNSSRSVTCIKKYPMVYNTDVCRLGNKLKVLMQGSILFTYNWTGYPQI